MVRIGPWVTRAWGILTEDIGQWLLIAVFAGLLYSLSGFLLIFAGFVIGPTCAGIQRAFDARMRGERPDLRHLWAGFDSVGTAGLAAFLISLLGALGFLLCIIPGIVLCTWWVLTIVVICEEGVGAWAAMQRSREIVSMDFWNWLLITLLVGVLIGAGSVVPVLGTGLGLVMGYLILSIGYREVVRGEMADAAPSAPTYVTPVPPPAVE